MKGNIILNSDELQSLRKALVERYCHLTKHNILDPDSLFNSNMENYKDLYESMDKVVALKANGILSVKPLLSLFYLSKRSPNALQSFRIKFIDCVYKYIYGQIRSESLLTYINKQTQIPTTNFLDNIKGYWECYYSIDNSFSRKFDSNEIATLNVIALLIKGDNIHNLKVSILNSEGEIEQGHIEVFGSNFILQLKNETSSSSSILLMNCGITSIENFPKHVEKATGIYTYPDSLVASIKSARSLMLYFDQTKLIDKYNINEIDLDDAEFKNKFITKYSKINISNKAKMDDTLLHIASFFNYQNIATDVSITDFTSDANLISIKTN